MRKNSKQLDLPLKGSRGGRRPGAGRPNRSGKQGHGRRERLNTRHPVHVTLKMASGVPSLRRKEVFRCLREAVCTARRQGFAVVHYAILSNHIHFILEPRGNSLGRLFQSLCISFAKRLNRIRGEKGAVFDDRYHVHVLHNPSEVRNALAYVLTNEARHRLRAEGRPVGRMKLRVTIDPFSSAWAFRNWRVLLRDRVELEVTRWSEAVIENWHDELLEKPRTWLLSKGWMVGNPRGDRSV